MLTPTEHKWIVQVMTKLEQGDTTELAAAKVYRTIGQLFESAAQRVEDRVIDRIENRLYNTNTQTEGATDA
jgi:hypothetical protein